jgi:predicted AlkP superfamily pyrophosphatase or phosphodiesterase
MRTTAQLALASLAALVLGGAGGSAKAAVDALVPSKLVTVITIDGLPQEQVLKYRDQLSEDGFLRLLREGAWFGDAHYGHSTTYTAVGHATILSGAYPYQHGLVANDWMDRETRERVYCVGDPDHQYLDEETPPFAGTSPKNLQVTTVGDELRMANGFESKVLSISVKDRGAMLTGGKFGTAYLYSTRTGRFISSTYYMDEYPDWWHEFHADNPQDQWFGEVWEPLLDREAYARSASDDRPYHTDYRNLGTSFPHQVDGGLEEPGAEYYAAMVWTPFGDIYTLDFIKAAVQGENLGNNPAGVPDVLAVSLSTMDYVNHLFGPESMQSHDQFLRLDQVMAEFLDFLDEWVGLEETMIVLTADHSFSNVPEYCQELGLGGGRVDPEQMVADLDEHLADLFKVENVAIAWWNPTIYIDYDIIDANGLDRAEVETAAARFLRDYEGIAHVFTRTQLENAQVPPHRLGEQVIRSWHAKLSGDLFLIQEPCWYLFGRPYLYAATHGSPYTYDTHVPLIFMGKWFQPGRYGAAAITDIAPTLAYLLGIRTPSGSEGRVLTEILNNDV